MLSVTVHALYGWKVTRQPVRVYFAGDVEDVRDGLVKRVFVECMRQWCGATQGRLKFMVTEDSEISRHHCVREFTSNHEAGRKIFQPFMMLAGSRQNQALSTALATKSAKLTLRAVLLHSAGHARQAIFEHTSDKNSAMNENCAHVFQAQLANHLSMRRGVHQRDGTDSYKTCWDNRHKKETIKVTQVPCESGLPYWSIAHGHT